jgi:hypothetical protein
MGTFQTLEGELDVFMVQMDSHFFQVFKSFLEVQFEGCVGEEEVTKDEYRILSAESYDRTFDEHNWSKIIAPKTQIVMSILVRAITQLASDSATCPRGCGVRLDQRQSSMATWLVLELWFVI